MKSILFLVLILSAFSLSAQSKAEKHLYVMNTETGKLKKFKRGASLHIFTVDSREILGKLFLVNESSVFINRGTKRSPLIVEIQNTNISRIKWELDPDGELLKIGFGYFFLSVYETVATPIVWERKGRDEGIKRAQITWTCLNISAIALALGSIEKDYSMGNQWHIVTR